MPHFMVPLGAIFGWQELILWGTRSGIKLTNGTGNGMGQYVLQTSDGGYAIAGQSAGGFWLIKTDDAGNVQWNRTYKEQEVSMAYSIIQTIDGGYALAGYTNFMRRSSGGGSLARKN